jgi:hypothetical protein
MRLNHAAIVALVFGLLFSGCGDTRPTPIGPSGLSDAHTGSPEAATWRAPALPGLPQTIAWRCGQVHITDQTASRGSAWSFQSEPAPCPAGPQRLTDRDLTTLASSSAIIAAAPSNLKSAVTGSTVHLSWDAVPEPVVSHVIEAGSASGLSNLAVVNTGTSATSVMATNVPAGVYYIRVRAVGGDGIPGPASNEVVVQTGLACTVAPGAPSGLSVQVTGNQVTLSWNAPSSGDAATSYFVEAGTGPGLSNIGVFNTGNAATSLSAIVPIGLYYVRIRGANSCGMGAPSSDIHFGDPEPPPPQTNPTPTPPTPTPPTPTPPTPTPPTPTPPTQTRYNASIVGRDSCNWDVNIERCPLEAVPESSMPSPHTFMWDLANGTVVGRGGNSVLPNWQAYGCALQLTGSSLKVTVIVTITGPGGAFASATKEITLFSTRQMPPPNCP